MGPACHPLCTINFLFLEFFLPPIFWLLSFSFDLKPHLKRWDSMSSSMYNKSLISWIFFHPLIFGYFLFLLFPCRLGTRMSSSMYNKVSFLGLFLAPDIWSLPFFFRSHATFETLRNLLAHGTRMSSSMYNKSLISWIFFHPLIFG